MYEQRYRFTMAGISPLIMHWDNIEWADALGELREQMRKSDKKKSVAGDDRSPPETWKGSLYNDGTRVAVPTDNLRSMLTKAASKIILKKNETYKKLLSAAVVFDDLFCEFTFNGQQLLVAKIDAIAGTFSEHLAAVRQLGFELLVKRARIGNSKHVRVRPMFTDWAVAGELTVVDQQITTDVLREIWLIAGLRIGLCDWRPDSPQSPGPYGKSRVSVNPE
ncbi:MAG: hypothetical protein ABIH03_07080 [Pseudomonadota bacterium]